MILTQTLCPDLPVHSTVEKYAPEGELRLRADELNDIDKRWILAAVYSMHNRRVFITNEYRGEPAPRTVA